MKKAEDWVEEYAGPETSFFYLKVKFVREIQQDARLSGFNEAREMAAQVADAFKTPWAGDSIRELQPKKVGGE